MDEFIEEYKCKYCGCIADWIGRVLNAGELLECRECKLLTLLRDGDD